MTAVDPQLTYEQALAQLDQTLRALEEGSLSLEAAIEAVARGREYLQLCERKLDEARQRIESLPVRDEGGRGRGGPASSQRCRITRAPRRGTRDTAGRDPVLSRAQAQLSGSSLRRSCSTSGRAGPGCWPCLKTPHS